MANFLKVGTPDTLKLKAISSKLNLAKLKSGRKFRNTIGEITNNLKLGFEKLRLGFELLMFY